MPTVATGMIACAEYDYGEIEDYNVQLLHAVAPVANYISSGDRMFYRYVR